MKSPDHIVEFVAFFEGYRITPYLDAGGKWTVGYGFRFVDGVQVGPNTRPMSQVEAKSLLREQLDTIERLVQADVLDVQLGRAPWELATWQWDALTSLVFNIGHHAWLQSTMFQLVKDGALDKAAQEFPRWCHVHGTPVHGLVMRRYWERHLWEHGYQAVDFLWEGIKHYRSPKHVGPGVPHE